MNIITIPSSPPRAPTPPTEVVVEDSIEQHSYKPGDAEIVSVVEPNIVEDSSSHDEDTPAKLTVMSTVPLRSHENGRSAKLGNKETYLKSRSPNYGQKTSCLSSILFTLGWVYSICRLAFVILQNLYHIPTYLFFSWIILYPIYFIKPGVFMYLENIMYHMCLYTVASWSWLAGIQVVECGDDICSLKDKSSMTLSSPTSLISSETISPPNNNGIVVTDFDDRTIQSPNNKIHNSFNVLNVKNLFFKTAVSPFTASREKKSGHEKSRNGKSIEVSEADSSIESVNLDSKPITKKRVLLLANHQCTTDVPLMFQALVGKTKYVLLWVMDYAFKYTNFGVVSATHGDYFIDPKTFVKSELTKHCLKNPDKDLIILFPEGGFRYKRANSSDKYAAKQGWPKLTHLTWPRHGAFMDLMEGKVKFSHIVDLTILYLDQELCMTIFDIAMGRNAQPVYFHYRTFEVTPDVILDEKWLNARWLEKEQLMKSFYDDPETFLKTNAGDLRPIKMSLVRLFFNQVLIFIGCIVMYTVIKLMLSVFIH